MWFLLEPFPGYFPTGHCGAPPPSMLARNVALRLQLDREAFHLFCKLAGTAHFAPHMPALTANTVQVRRGDFLAIWG